MGSSFPAYTAGGFYYLVPHYPSTTAYISMMAYWLTYSPGSDPNVNPFLAGGIEAPSTNSWLDIKTQTASATNLFWWFNAPSNLATAQTGKAAMFELWSSSTHTMSGWRHAYLGNARQAQGAIRRPAACLLWASGMRFAWGTPLFGELAAQPIAAPAANRAPAASASQAVRGRRRPRSTAEPTRRALAVRAGRQSSRKLRMTSGRESSLFANRTGARPELAFLASPD